MQVFLDGYADGLKEETAILDYLHHQIELYSDMCIGRHNEAINYISQKISPEIIMIFITNAKVPDELRASFCKLFLYLYVDRSPREPINLNIEKVTWKDIPEKINKNFKEIKNDLQNEFADIRRFIKEYLQNLTQNGDSFNAMVGRFIFKLKI